jgi:hypothetical protein
MSWRGSGQFEEEQGERGKAEYDRQLNSILVRSSVSLERYTLHYHSTAHDIDMATPGEHCDDTRPIDRVGYRVSALFVILLTSLVGTLFPIITKRVKYLRRRVPGVVFEFGKWVESCH